MAEVRLVPAQFKHVGRIARLMRPIDVEECRAMGRSPKQALRAGLMTSTKAWTALVDGQPEAMFGVSCVSVLGASGTPWFLGTEEVYRHPREMLMWGPGMIDRLSGSGAIRLQNYVSTRNAQAIRLLRKWGFIVSDEALSFGGLEFHPFQRLPTAIPCPA